MVLNPDICSIQIKILLFGQRKGKITNKFLIKSPFTRYLVGPNFMFSFRLISVVSVRRYHLKQNVKTIVPKLAGCRCEKLQFKNGAPGAYDHLKNDMPVELNWLNQYDRKLFDFRQAMLTHLLIILLD